jgi:6,7-dimethyl-8-ribityllumazine synthase
VSVTQGIKDLNVQTDIPVIFCVLTDNTMQQSIDRSGGIHGNKGTEAAIAAIKNGLYSSTSFFVSSS